MKITQKLLFGFFAIALLPLLIISIVGIKQQNRIITQLSIVDAIDIATTIEQSISVELGGLHLHENAKTLQKYVASLSETTGRDIAVVNKDKIILADIAEEADQVGKEFVHDRGEIRQTMQDGEPRVFEEVSGEVPQGVDLVVVPLYDRPHIEQENTQRQIIGAVITSYEPADLTGLKYTLLFTAVLVVIIIVIAGMLLSRSIYKPIAELKKAVIKIGDGKLDTQIEIKSKDEIAELAQAFNKMVQDLQKTTTSIKLLDREILERKNAEAELKKINTELAQINRELHVSNGKLEQANDELKNFTYIASHDLREPLRKITMFGATLENSLKGRLEVSDAESLKFMIEGADRMTKMIEGLLACSRVSTQTQPFKNIDMNEIVKKLCKFELAVVLEEKKVTIDITQSLPVVYVDPIQISELMQNLIANAIKYQPKGAIPKITITAKPAADNMTRIEVTDNGIGIKPEYQNQIFGMFKRLHPRTEYEGTGIGLSVCKKIVERHNGRIGVESQFGHGSTFWFTVPSAAVSAVAAVS